MTDKRLLDLLIYRIGSGVLEPCTCGCSEVTFLPTSEKTSMPHFVCNNCGRLYAFNGFIVLQCLRPDHIMDIDEIVATDETLGSLTPKEKEKMIEALKNDLALNLPRCPWE